MKQQQQTTLDAMKAKYVAIDPKMRELMCVIVCLEKQYKTRLNPKAAEWVAKISTCCCDSADWGAHFAFDIEGPVHLYCLQNFVIFFLFFDNF